MKDQSVARLCYRDWSREHYPPFRRKLKKIHVSRTSHKRQDNLTRLRLRKHHRSWGLDQFHLTAPSEIGLGMRSGLVVRAHDKIAATFGEAVLAVGRLGTLGLSTSQSRCADLCVVPRRIRYS